MALDLSSLRKALASLERAVGVASSEARMNAMEPEIREIIRAGVIQNFEFTYELCWKLMKRWLAHNVGESHVDGVTRRELFRLSAEYRLIADVDEWMDYHQARNRTSHTYDEKTALDVVEAGIAFVHAARHFLVQIEARND
ncbi:nucleotidyltransferase substrate binding protein [Magnetococcus sp. PR-3]|uniref:nucleotidyltransferase substrate binding protein n=1 Tax=Magnetococcus sp. PR-3 TaxID=3120355 RepID=UPI002FCDFA8C